MGYLKEVEHDLADLTVGRRYKVESIGLCGGHDVRFYAVLLKRHSACGLSQLVFDNGVVLSVTDSEHSGLSFRVLREG